MALRRHSPFLLMGILASMGASYATPNFVVEAPTPQIAQQVGQYAEHYRKQKAQEWLGQEMAQWPEPCPLKVKVTMSGPGGATSFAFDRGHVLGQHMHIEGPLDRLLASVLPHEVTHTVFAYYYRRPVPRWADEGGAVLSEDDLERDRHDKLVRQILNTSGRKIPLRRLFTLHDYPNDVMVLYAEGFSVANYLVEHGGRRVFLEFVAQGMNAGWDAAVKTYYGYNRVEDLEEAWLTHLRSTRRQPVQLALGNPGTAPGETTHRLTVRQTVPPGLPFMSPVVRAQQPEQEGYEDQVRPATAIRPGYLPDSIPPASGAASRGAGSNSSPDPWQPAGTAAPYRPPSVQLGAPQLALPPPPADLGRPLPAAASPVGYPK